jgi:hypothetical protein
MESLENLYPAIFGNYDKEQNYAIAKGYNCVILSENANELARIFIQEFGYKGHSNGYILDEILRVIGSKLGITIINSKTIEVLENLPYKRLEDDTQIDNLAYIISEFIKSDATMFGTVIGINLRIDEESFDTYGGHYCALLIEKKAGRIIVHIFDPMHSEMDHGGYIIHFLSLISEIMGKVGGAFEILPVNIFKNEKQKLQSTGGFSGNSPQFHDVYIREYGERFTNNDIQKFGQDSQNHFCYMWCIWFLHMRTSFPSDIADSILSTIGKHIESGVCVPLVIIKRYMYALFFGADAIAAEFRKFQIIAHQKKNHRRITAHMTNDAIYVFMKQHFPTVCIFPIPKTDGTMLSRYITTDLNDVAMLTFDQAVQYSYVMLMTQSGDLIPYPSLGGSLVNSKKQKYSLLWR